jgi:tetratricopeptide (TPR) repeat protein
LGHYNENVLTRLLLLFTIAIVLAVTPLPLYAQRTTVLVNAFTNDTSERNLDWIGEGLATAIADRLTSQRALYVYGRDERQAEYERLGIPEPLSVSRATSIRIAWDLGADILITGRFSGSHDEFRVEARVLNLVENAIDLDLSVTGKLEDLIPMSASLASRLAGALVPGSTMPESDYAARPPIPRSAFEAYIRGVMSVDAERRSELLADAVRLHPQYMSAIYQLGLAHYLDSDYQQSNGLLERVSSDSPEYPMARFMIGMNAYHLNDFGKAAAIYSTIEPAYDILVNLGASLAAGGDPLAAESVLKRALEKNPAGSEAIFDLAYVAFIKGDWTVAATRFSQFLQGRGRDSEALFMLGQTYIFLGRNDDSRRVTAQAVRQSPNLSRWVTQGVPNLLRLRTQFDATELRLPGGVWNEARRARKAGAGE